MQRMGLSLAVFIPFYGRYLLYRRVGVSTVGFLLSYIPVVGIVSLWGLSSKMAVGFRRNRLWGLLILCLPCVAFPVLMWEQSQWQKKI